MRSVSTIVWIVLVILGGAAAYRFSPFWNGSGDKEPKFETAQLSRGAVVAKVTASGTLSARRTVQVGSQVSGRIKELPADFNTQVTKGQVIARIDPQLFNATLAQARANHTAAKAELQKAKVQAEDADRQLARTRSLSERKLVAQAELDTAQATTDMAKASVAAAAGRVAQLKAALDQAQVNLNYTTISSPITGIVISRNVDEGQTVAASLQAPVLFVIAEDLRKMQVDTSVAEADVGKLQAGMRATFNVDAYPSERFEGTVREIRNSPQTVQNVVTYDAVIDVDNPDLKLRPGMTANVTFVWASNEDALRVPNAALRFRPSADMLGTEKSGDAAPAAKAVKAAKRASDPRSNKRTVWVLRADKPAPVELTTGITDGSFTEVVGGELSEGDTVITDTAGGAKPATTPGGGGMPMRRVL